MDKIDLNNQEKTDLPQIHLSGEDGETKYKATEIVFHKMKDGTIFVEWFLQSEQADSIGCPHLQTTLNETAKNKLIEFLNNKTTY